MLCEAITIAGYGVFYCSGALKTEALLNTVLFASYFCIGIVTVALLFIRKFDGGMLLETGNGLGYGDARSIFMRGKWYDIFILK